MTPLTFTFHDVNEAYTDLQTIKHHYTETEFTRNGEAQVFGAPAIIEHTHPQRRVLFDPVRDANPFFHFMEAIWMLGGRDDVGFPAYYAKNLANYSDDGDSFHGAYGQRWVHQFDVDQISAVIDMLKTDPETRRAVIAMWDPVDDLMANSKDLPCNTHIYFRNTQEGLTMTVCNRSNDMVWGMLGSNIVHFSILHEYIANAVGMGMGSLYQFTNNLHIYKGWEDKYSLAPDRWYRQPHDLGWEFGPTTFNYLEALRFMDGDHEIPKCRILRDVAFPMRSAYTRYKDGDINSAVVHANQIRNEDWRRACVLWLERRRNK